MKEDPKDHVTTDHEIDSRHEEEGGKEGSQRNLEYGKSKKWYKMIDYERIIPFMPKLRNIRGSKKKLNITVHSEISEEAQSLFERQKHFFRHRAQVDVMAYYLGIRMMVEIYLTRPGFYRDKLSELLESQEKEQMIFDQMSIIKDKFRKDLELFQDDLISEKEIHEKIDLFLETFPEGEHRRKMEKILDKMIGVPEVAKAKDRLRKRAEYKRSKLQLVGE